MTLWVEQLWHYPLKSAQGIAMSQADLHPHGIAQDRRWLLVDADGQMLTQRQLPQLGALQVALPAVQHMALTATLHLTGLGVGLCATASVDWPEQATVWGDTLAAWGVPDLINQQLSAVFGQAVRLVYCPDDTVRAVDPEYAAGYRTAFSDGFPVLVLSQSSLDALSAHWGQSVDVRRFRPNLLIAGDCAPFAEDTWSSIQIGGLTFDLVKPCSRCVIPTLDPDQQQPTQGFARFLATQRRHANGKIYVGQNAVIRQAQTATSLATVLGKIAVGDVVDVQVDHGD
ncbi:MAG: MOSC N-terminal beta barrel domain-containing protein [Pseudomonadota bacterium]|nr:MOSC N-terminal beta barrel domain-containing protein [Pseudomonadota bacterium]